MNKRWMKWHPVDWRADPCLRMCGYAARGLWADLLTLMHEAEPYGHLLVGGISPTARQIAGLLGGTEKEVKILLGELEAAGVFSRTEKGIIYSRRMVRDEARALTNLKNGTKGGNPVLIKSVNPPVNTPVNPRVNAKTSDLRHKKEDPPKAPPRGLASEFGEFWLAYPHKVGKGAAEKAFATARKRAELPELLAGIKRYPSIKRDDTPWCNPATWLNQQRWLDQPDLPLSNGHDDRPPPAPLDPRKLGHSLPCACNNCTRWAALHAQEAQHA